MYIPEEDKALKKSIDIAKNSEKYREEYLNKRQQLLKDEIDVSSWMRDLILKDIGSSFGGAKQNLRNKNVRN